MKSRPAPKDDRLSELAFLRRRVNELEASNARFMHVEENRRETENLYHALLGQSFDGVYLYLPDTKRILDANQQLLDMVRYSREELSFLRLFDIAVLDEETSNEELRRVNLRKGSVTALRHYRRKDGSIIDAETSATLVGYHGSSAVLVSVHDITDRRHAEKEFESRAAVMQKQAELLDIAEDAIMVRDLDERIIFWNRGAQERYGWTKEQALGRIVHDLLQTESALPFETLRTELFAKGSLTAELTHVTRGGARIMVESRWTVRRDGEGKPLAIMEINSDITQRKRTEKVLQTAKEELERRVAERTAELQSANQRLSLELERRTRIQEMLRKAAERYRNLFYNSPMGIYRTNPNGRILMANPSLFRMLGYSSFDTLASLEADKRLYEPTYLRKRFLNRLRRDDRVRGFEASWKRHDGSTIFVRENAKTVRSPDGAILYYEGTVEDISEQKKAEEDIHFYQKQLRSLAAELSLRKKERGAGSP